MNPSSTSQDAERLLRDGWSDEDVERLTGMSLDAILGLRAEAASAPVDPKPARVFKAAIRARDPAKAVERLRSPPGGQAPDEPPGNGRSPA